MKTRREEVSVVGASLTVSRASAGRLTTSRAGRAVVALGAWADYGWMALRTRRYRADAERYLREKEQLRSARGG